MTNLLIPAQITKKPGIRASWECQELYKGKPCPSYNEGTKNP